MAAEDASLALRRSKGFREKGGVANLSPILLFFNCHLNEKGVNAPHRDGFSFLFSAFFRFSFRNISSHCVSHPQQSLHRVGQEDLSSNNGITAILRQCFMGSLVCPVRCN